MQYSAYFVAGSDSEFTVSPQTGELAPVDAKPTPICVHFTPSKYGKKYTSKLVVQVINGQRSRVCSWLFEYLFDIGNWADDTKKNIWNVTHRDKSIYRPQTCSGPTTYLAFCLITSHLEGSPCLARARMVVTRDSRSTTMLGTIWNCWLQQCPPPSRELLSSPKEWLKFRVLIKIDFVKI